MRPADVLPPGWITATVGEIAEIAYGRALPARMRREEGRIPVYSSAGRTGSHDEALHPGPAVVVGRKGAVGRVHYVDGPFWCIDTAFYLGRLSPSADPEYMACALRWLDLGRLATGAGIPGLGREVLARQRVALPPLDEQRHIVRILRAADAVRIRSEEIDRVADDVPGSLFVHYFGDPASNLRKWESVLVEDLLSPGRGMQTGPFGTSLRKVEYVESGVPVWGIENIGDNEFFATPPYHISPEKFRELNQFSVRDGDVLVSRAGTAGRMAVARVGDGESIIGTNLIRISLRRDLVVPEYFTTLATSFGDSVGELRASGSGYTFTRPSLLKRISVPLPPLEVQERFLAALRRFQEYRAGRRATSAPVGELLDSLHVRAFSGELTATWREGDRDEVEAVQERPVVEVRPVGASAATLPQLVKPRPFLLSALSHVQLAVLEWIELSPGYVTSTAVADAEPLRPLDLTSVQLRQALSLLEQTGLVQRVSVPQRIGDREVDRFIPAYRRILADRDTADDPFPERTA